MCGIVGAVSSAPVDPTCIAKMRDQIVHRGPDDQGLWLAEDGHVCLGFRRLAIVDLTPEANQPFHSHDDRFVIVFNGEIYNFKKLRVELQGQGVRFRTCSDTEVLIEAFRRWGERCLERLSGMFAFAIWDTQQRRLFCARDRAGEKPFYYARLNGSFVFASELKALTPWPGFRRNLHYPALVDFLTFGFVPDPKTIWEDCRKLPPGHSMWVELAPDNTPIVREPVPYWDLEFQPDASVKDWGPCILETLQHASQEMSFADVPLGTFLSGGVDSSSVTAALTRAGCSVNAFTVGFDSQEYDERPWARQVAQLCGAQHTERVVTPDDVKAVFQKMVWHYDEPFNDYSYLPTYYVCREARKSITVALSGDGGDELFAGYTKYRRLGLRSAVHSVMPAPVGRIAAKGADLLMPETSRLRRTLVQHGADTPAMLLDMLTLGFSSSALGRAARGQLAQALREYSPMDVVRPLLAKAPPREVGLINAMRYLDLKLTLSGDILVKVDRASMAVSLEVRPVYLHRDLMELAARIPPALLADRREAKKALKNALRAWLPDTILDRGKMGFALPLKQWLRNGLGTLPEGKDGGAFGDLLDAGLLEKLARQHAAGAADQTSAIHSLVFLRNWMATWL